MKIEFTYNNNFFPNDDFAILTIMDSEWEIQKCSSNCLFRKGYPITELDYVFCGILNHYGGTLSKNEFARLLGFSLIDLPNENIYRDEAEEKVLDILLKDCEKYGLIKKIPEPSKETEKVPQYLKLTNEGKQSLSSKIKYEYYNGQFSYFRHKYHYDNPTIDFDKIFSLCNTAPSTSLSAKEKGIFCSISDSFAYKLINSQLLKVPDNDLELVSIKENSGKQQKNQSVQYVLLENNAHEDLLLVVKEGEVQEHLTDIINSPENEFFKNNLVLRCRFKILIEDKNAVFDGKTVNKFLKLWDRESLLKDDRLRWSDVELWSLFRTKFTSKEWQSITTQAPLTIIEYRLKAYSDTLNWAVLSKRMNPDFIKQHLFSEEYRWDFEVISGREQTFVLSLIAQINEYNLGKADKFIPVWDFVLITEGLADKKIEELLHYRYNLDFIQLSKRSPDFVISWMTKISQINLELAENEPPYKVNWDWIYISKNWSIGTIWKNFELLEVHLIFHTFLIRAFSNEQYAPIFLKSAQFKNRILRNKEKVRPTFRLEELLWNEPLIDLFQETEILLWQSNNSQLGFECNPSIRWTPELLEKYKGYFTTEIGQAYISKNVKSWTFIFKVPNFKWNWNELCKNEHLNFSLYILKHYREDINWEIITRRKKEDFIFEYLFEHDWNFGLLSTEKSNDFIAKALRKGDDVLERDWDWPHLTSKLDKNFITENLVNIGEKWDWKYLTRHIFEKDEIINLWKVTVEYWDWEYLLSELFTKEELNDDDYFTLIAYNLNQIESEDSKKVAWSILTQRVSPEFLASNRYQRLEDEVLQWDWNYLSQHPQFSYTIDFLKYFSEKWNWEVLSQNTWINSNWEYLEIFSEEWDWAYISQHSLFVIGYNNKLDIRTLRRFRKQIDFSTFSLRKDISINNNLINRFSKEAWDFHFLSGIRTVEPNRRFLRKYIDRNWDWQQLSKRYDLIPQKQHPEGEVENQFLNQLLVEFQEKEWDWHYLSTRKDIKFSFEFLTPLKNKDWNFKAISRNSQTIWTTKLINFFQLEKVVLDWDYISEHTATIYKDIANLEKLKSYLNWDKISVNPNIYINEELLKQFQDDWNFKLLTRREEIISNIGYFILFKNKDWDWRYFTRKSVTRFDINVLSALSDKIDWDELSRAEDLALSKEWIKKFENFWNFVELFKRQDQFEEEVITFLKPYFELPKNKFLIKMEEQHSYWSGSIYHFTHLSNAVKIIKEKAIKSRYSADQINNSAGSVPDSSNKPKSYARFYYRPQTPAQFYNENLGKSPSDDYVKTWMYDGQHYSHPIRNYSKAAAMGFPKCPVPIFFKIDLKEVLDKFYSNCYISNGNMQSSWAKIFSIENGINYFDFENLFMSYDSQQWEIYKEASQQEFLVRNELNLSKLNSLKIICQNAIDKQTLLNFVGNDNEFSDKIEIEEYGGIYNQKNSRYQVKSKDNGLTLSVSTLFDGAGKTVIKTSRADCIKEIEGEVYKVNKYVIEAGKDIQVSFSELVDYQVYFIDESEQEWLLYGTKEFD